MTNNLVFKAKVVFVIGATIAAMFLLLAGVVFGFVSITNYLVQYKHIFLFAVLLFTTISVILLVLYKSGYKPNNTNNSSVVYEDDYYERTHFDPACSMYLGNIWHDM